MADPEFSDAVRYLFRDFEGAEADIAFAMRELEDQIYSGMDVEAKNAKDRSLTPEHLEEEDVAGLERSGRDLQAALPVAVAGLSEYTPEQHTAVQLLADQTPVEPYSPDYYDRTFLEGEACWADRSCELLRTDNDLTKDNLLMTVDYAFFKDFRWIDLNLPAPSSVEEGEDPVNGGAPRWAFLGRAWSTKSYPGRSGDTSIHQFYTVEVWIPAPGGSLRMLSLWSETDPGPFSEDQISATTQQGIDTNFQAVESWLEENAR